MSQKRKVKSTKMTIFAVEVYIIFRCNVFVNDMTGSLWHQSNLTSLSCEEHKFAKHLKVGYQSKSHVKYIARDWFPRIPAFLSLCNWAIWVSKE